MKRIFYRLALLFLIPRSQIDNNLLSKKCIDHENFDGFVFFYGFVGVKIITSINKCKDHFFFC
jgi:hypothetical protein